MEFNFDSLSFGDSPKSNNDSPTKDEELELFISGGISGAITNPLSDEALKYAKIQYEAIRKRKGDVEAIVKNLNGMCSYDEIQKIKNYLFINEHLLDGKMKRFDPCFEIAQSWERLSYHFKDVQEHDITMIKHELYEMDLIEQGYPQDEAHRITCKIYDYPTESTEFYKMLKAKKKAKG